MFKRLLFFALVAFAAWYGWKNYGSLMSQLNKKSGDVVVVNHSGAALERIRVSVGDQTVVVETLEDGATVQMPFQPNRDGTFHVVWKSRATLGEREWTGGAANSSAVQTNRFEFTSDRVVNWTSKEKGTG